MHHENVHFPSARTSIPHKLFVEGLDKEIFYYNIPPKKMISFNLSFFTSWNFAGS